MFPKSTRKCPRCDTVLEIESIDHVYTFSAHTPEFCHDLTWYRVKVLEQALVSQRECYENVLKNAREHFDRILSKAGLPSLAERAKLNEVRAKLAETKFLTQPQIFEDLK